MVSPTFFYQKIQELMKIAQLWNMPFYSFLQKKYINHGEQ